MLQDLQEEIARMLTTNNPEMPDSLVEFSFKERSFVMTLLPPHMITLLEMEGTCLHKETQEAKEQIEQEGGWGGQFSFLHFYLRVRRIRNALLLFGKT